MLEVVAVVKAVYDTNTIVSGILSPRIPRLTLLLATNGRVKPFVSPSLLEEYRKVLQRSKFQRRPNVPLRILEIIERHATLVFPTTTLNVTLDPSDNRVVECAREAEAQYIVTGNKKHFPFSTYEGIKIVDAREFLEEVAPDMLRIFEILILE